MEGGCGKEQPLIGGEAHVRVGSPDASTRTECVGETGVCIQAHVRYVLCAEQCNAVQHQRALSQGQQNLQIFPHEITGKKMCMCVLTASVV
jgi:hypothetical protein